MLKQLSAITRNTIRGFLHDRILFSVILYAVLLVLISLGAGNVRVSGQDIAFAFTRLYISYFGTMGAVLLGAGLVSRDIKSGTAREILARPVPRPLFLLGKYLGLVSALLLCVAGVMVVFFVVRAAAGKGWAGQIIKPVYLTCIKLMVLSSVAFFFSVVTRPLPAVMMSLLVATAGNVMEQVKTAVGGIASPSLQAVVKFFSVVIPNFYFFTLRGEPFTKVPILDARVSLSLLYGLMYVTFLYALSVIIFSRKNVQ